MKSLVFPEFLLYVLFFISLDEIGLAQFLHLLLFDTNFSAVMFQQKNITCESLEHKVQLLLGGAWGTTNQIKKSIKKMGGYDERISAINNQQFVNFCLKNRSLLSLIVTHHLNVKRKIHAASNKNNWENRTPESGSLWDGRYGIGNYLMNDISRLRCDLHKIEVDPDFVVGDVVPVAVPVLDVVSDAPE